MNLQHRIELLEKLGKYILSDNVDWKAIKEKAARENSWFIPEFIDLASDAIATSFLDTAALNEVAEKYGLATAPNQPKTVGVVMAGNIPLVGFHDFLVVFLSGHRQVIKSSSRDAVLIRHLVETLIEWDPAVSQWVSFAEMLKGCDAYIATGSNNTSRYFEQYFGKYPHVIRRNRTSVAILDGNESRHDLERLASDVYQYFGLGCRNVTKVFVPTGYDFVPLLEAFKKYNYLVDFHKYKNNYDYQLAVLIINKLFYMTNGSIVLHESTLPFSPISQLNYEFYDNREKVADSLRNNSDIQAVVGNGYLPFGEGQRPRLLDFADGTDTLKFLRNL